MAPLQGYYRTHTLTSRRDADLGQAKRLYLALLPGGRFVLSLGPAEGFDFAAYAAGALGEFRRTRDALAWGGWSYFHQLGEYRVEDGLTVTFTARMVLGQAVHVQRWSAGCVSPELLLARGEVYRHYQPEESPGGGPSCE